MMTAHPEARDLIPDEPADVAMWRELLATYETLKWRRDARARVRLEAVLEALYSQACASGDDYIDELEAVLASPPAPRVALAWQMLLHLVRTYDLDELAELDALVGKIPPRSAWLIAAEAARLTYQAVGPQAAWQRIAAVEPVLAEEDWLDEGPLVIHALLLQLRLAAASGQWDSHDAWIEPACARFGAPDDPRVLHIRLVGADHDVMRGCYERAARTLDELEPRCQGDLRLELLTVRLHALVACAAQQRDTGLRAAIERTMAELDQACQAPPDESYPLPADERADLIRRVAQLVDHAGADARDLDPEQVTSLADALAVERRARREQSARPPLEILAALLPPVEALLGEESAVEHHESWLRLRLLWCRLIVDVADIDRYDDCELMLTQIIEETTRTGLMPLAISAYDQRAVLLAQAQVGAWDRALADAGRAGELAVSLLAGNSSPGTGQNQRILERALLGTLLPVLDRVIDLLLMHALTHAPEGGCSRVAWARSDSQRWVRFGRAIHDYVEQSQVLALKEARHAYGAGDTPVPHRFALVAPGEVPTSPLPRLRAALRPRDAVLQYFVTGPHILIFVYTRSHFDWLAVDAAAAARRAGAELEAPTAHAALLHFIAACDTWLKGESTSQHESSAEPLRQLLLPDVLTSHLAKARIRHVRIIPHDVLYRVPFGRLRWGDRLLVERASLSLHPTAGLAAESAEHSLRRRKRMTLGYLFDPELRHVAREQAAIRDGLGRSPQLARMVALDAASASGTDEIVQQIAGLGMLHVACHGGRPFQRREAFMKLGPSKWKLSEVAAVHLRQCALVVLQSCWTGWMEHERTNPVQGFPQALCDAGVAAVIAPLVKVPGALAPIFAQVLYRFLRFSPAEQALRKTLDVLREHGPELVADDPDASRDWNELGPLDALEYRYVGRTSLHLAGGITARLLGRLSCWQWRRQLRRQRARREAAALPARCDH